MAASICKARILRFSCMLLRREDKAQAIRNTSFPSTVISYRKKNKAIPGILMEDCYTILLPVIVSNHCGQTSKSLFLFFIAGISFTS